MQARSDLRIVLQRWLALAALWWRCPAERHRAWGFSALCVVCSLFNVALLVWISYAQKALQSALSEKQEGKHGGRERHRLLHTPLSHW